MYPMQRYAKFFNIILKKYVIVKKLCKSAVMGAWKGDGGMQKKGHPD